MLFSFFSVGLVSLDLGSDSIQAQDYIENEHKYWGYSTISMMFVTLLSVCIYVILNRRKELWNRDEGAWKNAFMKIGSHVPLVQPFVHISYLLRLLSAKSKIERSLEFYKSFNPDIITDENREDFQRDVQQAGDDYVEAKHEYQKIMTEFQQMKLFEVFGESAPQATLQIAIVLQLGTFRRKYDN